jgi:peptidoglycan DL-endopeptidase CwlO
MLREKNWRLKNETQSSLLRNVKLLQFLITIGIAIFGIHASVSAQVKEFDKLEQLYAQQHYKLVYMKSIKLMDRPDNDYSQLPKFYNSLSLFQLSKNQRWLKRNQNALAIASKLFDEIKTSSEGFRVFNAHINEVSELKEDLFSWGEDLKRTREDETADQLEKILVTLFDKVPSVRQKTGNPIKKNTPSNNDKRSQVIAFAEKQIGVPYVWAGTTPKGFDCSGFTGYVLKEFDITVPRRAVDQQKSSKKIKEKNAQKGDLIFFNSGSGISHVGIIVSENGESLKMIHASSSKGVIITDLESSSYWKNRLDSFGSYLD